MVHDMVFVYNSNSVMNGGGLGGIGGGGVTVVTGSRMVSSDGLGKSNGGDTSSVSPVPYVFNGVFRGRKHGAIEKVVERRQRKMIKNRESAARSRARKQVYTMELEAEVSELKQKNQELKRKLMADLLTALMYAVQVMNFLKTLITKNLREREDAVIESSRGPPQEPPLDENGDQGPMNSPTVDFAPLGWKGRLWIARCGMQPAMVTPFGFNFAISYG
ncbi:putative transcription factor bZIP family [Helianthus annuus]|nr:putative transcription factor bZIP family [Helianthus annuus]